MVMLLGPFAAKNGEGADLVLPKKGQALLAFLMVNRGRQVARDDLSALLWSNTGSDQARHSLRQCLSVFRRTFAHAAGPLLVQTDKLTLSHATALTSDLEALERLEKSGSLADLADADALYRGEFLAGLCLPGEPFDDWVSSERQRLADARLRILTNLAGLHAQANDYATAIETAKRLTALDPFREESSRLLMELLAASGQRGLAIVEHARVERRLREELQLAPDPATRRLAERIRRGQPAQRQIPQSSATPPAHFSAANPLDSASAPGSRLLLSDRVTVALLPFVNLTGDPSHDHFAQGLTEDVASALVRERWPIVVTTPTLAPGSVVPVKGLFNVGVRYVASASVRREGGKVRVVVRLTDALLARHLWSGQVEATAELAVRSP